MYTTGILLAVSYSKGSLGPVLYKRFRRFLIPFWAYGTVALSIMSIFGQGFDLTPGRVLRWVLPYAAPQGADWTLGWLSSPLWYLAAYMWLLLLSPLIYTFVKKTSLPFCGLYGCLILSLVGALEYRYGTSLWLLQDVVLYGFFLYLGMVMAIKRVILSKKNLFLSAIASGILVAGVRVVGNYDSYVVNDSHVTHALMGLICIALFRVFEEYIESSFKRWGGFLRYISSRSLTIYMWHSGLIAFTILALGRATSWQEYYVRPLSIGLALVATLLLAHTVGFLETYSSGSLVKVSRKSTTFAGALLVVYGLFASTVWLSTETTLASALPATPSRAPSDVYGAEDSENFFLPGTNLDTGVFDASTEASSTDVDSADVAADKAGDEDKENKTSTTVPDVKIGGSPEYTASSIRATDTWEELAPMAGLVMREAVENVLENHIENNTYENIQLVIVKPGDYKLVLGGATSDAVYDISSVTKAFTGSLVLRAVAEGRLSLDRKLGALVAAPWFTVGAEATVGNLLSHRSGIVDYTHTTEYKGDPSSINNWQTALGAVQSQLLAFKPGTREGYSSTNYILLGLLLEELYGAPVERLIESMLLLPLGLDATGVREAQAARPGKGTGNMYSSLSDLARWVNSRWRADEVVVTTAVDSESRFAGSLSGYGEWGFCPCQKVAGRGLVPSAIGISGGDITLRYYPVKDIIIVARMDGGIWDDGREKHLNKILTALVALL